MKTTHVILTVDDRQDFLRTFQKTFEEDFSLLTSLSPAEARKLLNSRSDIAVILCDQRMPEMLGTDFLAEVKNKYPQVVRLLITAYTDMDAVIKAINNGAVFKYIQKPYDDAQMKSLLNEAFAFYERNVEIAKMANHTMKLLQEKTSHAMENYTAWVAHHVNNALQSIRTFVDLALPRFEADEAEKSFAQTTQNNIRRLAEVMQQLRNTYSHGLEQFAKGPLSTLLEFDNAALSTLLRDKKIVIKKEVREPDLQITADPMAIQEAIRRLVVNAVEASPEGATIEVKAAKHESDGQEEVMFLVQDHGKGISPEIKEKLFYPFMNVDGGDHPRGLGLTYVQSVVARHGGDIQVDTVVGKGTSVSFSLPIIQPEKEETALDQLARQKLKHPKQ